MTTKGEIVRARGEPLTADDLDVLTRACQAGAFGNFPNYSLTALVEGAESILGRPLPGDWEVAIRGDDVVVARLLPGGRWLVPNLALDNGAEKPDNGG